MKSMPRRNLSLASKPAPLVFPHHDRKQVFAGCASGDIKVLDLATSQGIYIGGHSKPVKNVHWVEDLNVLCSVSFEKTLKLWDLRQSDPVYQFELKHKPMCSDLHGSKLALALSDFQVAFVDLAEAIKMQSSEEFFHYKISPLGSRDPVTAIKFLPNGKRVAFGSAGGKRNLSKIIDNGSKTAEFLNEITFKAHRVEESNKMDVAYPVNSLLVISKMADRFLGFCVGEGSICPWDFQSLNKIEEFKMKDSVTCGEMSPDGNWLAFATGYDWSRGISGYMTKASEIYVRPVRY